MAHTLSRMLHVLFFAFLPMYLSVGLPSQAEEIFFTPPPEFRPNIEIVYSPLKGGPESYGDWYRGYSQSHFGEQPSFFAFGISNHGIWTATEGDAAFLNVWNSQYLGRDYTEFNLHFRQLPQYIERLRVFVDGAEAAVLDTEIVTCPRKGEGCIIQTRVPAGAAADGVVSALKRGNRLLIVNEISSDVLAEVSLRGFTKAFNSSVNYYYSINGFYDRPEFGNEVMGASPQEIDAIIAGGAAEIFRILRSHYPGDGLYFLSEHYIERFPRGDDGPLSRTQFESILNSEWIRNYPANTSDEWIEALDDFEQRGWRRGEPYPYREDYRIPISEGVSYKKVASYVSLMKED